MNKIDRRFCSEIKNENKARKKAQLAAE